MEPISSKWIIFLLRLFWLGSSVSPFFIAQRSRQFFHIDLAKVPGMLRKKVSKLFRRLEKSWNRHFRHFQEVSLSFKSLLGPFLLPSRKSNNEKEMESRIRSQLRTAAKWKSPFFQGSEPSQGPPSSRLTPLLPSSLHILTFFILFFSG